VSGSNAACTLRYAICTADMNISSIAYIQCMNIYLQYNASFLTYCSYHKLPDEDDLPTVLVCKHLHSGLLDSSVNTLTRQSHNSYAALCHTCTGYCMKAAVTLHCALIHTSVVVIAYMQYVLALQVYNFVSNCACSIFV
jgi:hypothetical protein